MAPERVVEIVEHAKELVDEIEEPIENLEIEEPIEDIEIEEPVQDIESPTEKTKDPASATGKQPMDGKNEGLFGGGHRGEGRVDNSLSTLEFPIEDLPRGTTPMKNIPLSSLPNFHGLSFEDLDEFLFEFDILCRSYDCITNSKKLKLFPTTLKGNALRWFMSLGGNVITTWDQMKHKFFHKYQDYW